MKQTSVIIGMDIGGTKILAEAFDAKGRVVERHKEETVTKGRAALLRQVDGLLERLFHKGIRGIGIAVPGIVERETGNVIHAKHLPVKSALPLQDIVAKRFKVPVTVDNDINAFLNAEKNRPELKGVRNIVAVMVGTGVGGAVIADGNMLYGGKGFAGEVGHMVVDICDSRRTLEQSVGGHFIPQIARGLGIKKAMKTTDLDKDTPNTRKVKRALVERLGIGLSNLNLIFNPEVFVLGGSIYTLFIRSEKRRLEKIIATYALDGKCPRIISARGSTSVAEGVAKLAMGNKK